jgi:uncharacterized protein
MRVAVLSDIHDNVWKLAAALAYIRDCDQLICCGDLCSPFVIDQLAQGFAGPIDIVFGNNDADLFRITAKAPRYPHLHLRGELFETEVAGRRIAVNHFDAIGLALARGGQYDAVFYGHNHAPKIEQLGPTLAVNPGSLMGAQFSAHGERADVDPTFAIYAPATNTARLYRLADGGVVEA